MKKHSLRALALALVSTFFCISQSSAQFSLTGTNDLTSLEYDKVGIGLEDPDIDRRLHIFKEIPMSPPSAFLDRTVGLRLELGIEQTSIASLWDLATDGGAFHIYEAFNDKSYFYIYNNGFTGINTTSPQGRLDVNSGTTSDYQDALFVRAHVSTPNMGGIIHHQGVQYGWQEIAQSTASPTGGLLRFNYTNRYSPGEEIIAANVLVLRANGRVGINTVSPAYSLDVNGSARTTSLDVCNRVRAEEVEVQLSTWCDYVFEDNYALRSLSDLEDYIKANKHLPEIPTTKEVLEEGVALGEMNALLLKKVEELTLYIIQQNKRLTELEHALAR